MEIDMPTFLSRSRLSPWRAMVRLLDSIFKTRALFSKQMPWSRLLPFRSLLGRFHRIDEGADFRGVNAR
jgi:hypothetical protein